MTISALFLNLIILQLSLKYIMIIQFNILDSIEFQCFTKYIN
jgi:hypothetical protein